MTERPQLDAANDRYPKRAPRRLTAALCISLSLSACAASPLERQRERLRDIERCLYLYLEDCRTVPDSGNAELTRALSDSSKRYYLAVAPTEISHDGKILDCWGRPYVFKRPSWASHPVECYLYSTGPNGIDEEGSGDDVLAPQDDY